MPYLLLDTRYERTIPHHTMTPYYTKVSEYGKTDGNKGKSCKDILRINPSAESGKYFVTQSNNAIYPVYCEMDSEYKGGGWQLLLTLTHPHRMFTGSRHPLGYTDVNANAPSVTGGYARNWNGVNMPQVNDEFLIRESGGQWKTFKMTHTHCGWASSSSGVCTGCHGTYAKGQIYNEDGSPVPCGENGCWLNSCSVSGGCKNDDCDTIGFNADHADYNALYGGEYFQSFGSGWGAPMDGANCGGAWGREHRNDVFPLNLFYRRAEKLTTIATPPYCTVRGGHSRFNSQQPAQATNSSTTAAAAATSNPVSGEFLVNDKLWTKNGDVKYRSSAYDASYEPQNTLDGVDGNPWHSGKAADGDGNTEWVAYDLGNAVCLDAIATTQPDGRWNGAEFKNMRVEISDAIDGKWVAVKAFVGQQIKTEQLFQFSPTTAQYWRIVMVSEWGYGFFTLQTIRFRAGACLSTAAATGSGVYASNTSCISRGTRVVYTVVPNVEISISSHSTCYSEGRCAENTLDGATCIECADDMLDDEICIGRGLDVLWHPNSGGSIVYDMGVARKISSVTIWNQNEYNDCRNHITGYDLSYSDNPTNGFAVVAQPRDFRCRTSSKRQCPNPDVDTTEVTGGNSARYWKLEIPDVCKSNGHFGFMEIEFTEVTPSPEGCICKVITTSTTTPTTIATTTVTSASADASNGSPDGKKSGTTGKEVAGSNSSTNKTSDLVTNNSSKRGGTTSAIVIVVLLLVGVGVFWGRRQWLAHNAESSRREQAILELNGGDGGMEMVENPLARSASRKLPTVPTYENVAEQQLQPVANDRADVTPPLIPASRHGAPRAATPQLYSTPADLDPATLYKSPADADSAAAAGVQVQVYSVPTDGGNIDLYQPADGGHAYAESSTLNNGGCGIEYANAHEDDVGVYSNA